MTRKTPSKTPAKTPAKRTATPDAARTPSRVARIEEKTELQDLNKRLEFYILKQRERDASAGSIQRTVEENKDFYEAEIKKLKALHEAQVKEFRQQRDAKDAEVEKLASENGRQAIQVKLFTTQIAADKARVKELEDRNATISDKLSTAQASLAQFKEAAKKSQHSTATLDAEKASLEASLQTAEDSIAQQAQSLASALSQSKNIQEDFNALQIKYNTERSRAQSLEAELSKTTAKVEDDLRKIFGAQLKEIVKEHQAQFKVEKQQGLDDLRELYEAKCSEMQDKISQYQSDLLSAHARASELAGKVEDNKAGSDYDSIVSSWETRVESLQEQLTYERSAADARAAATARDTAKLVASLRADIAELESQAASTNSASASLAKAREEVSFHKSERAVLQAEIKDQKKQLVAASSQARKIEAMQAQVDFLSGENTSLKADIKQCEAEYISLMDVKVALDMEIRAYRLLIENEEDRLSPPTEVVEDTKHTEEVVEAEEEEEKEEAPKQNKRRRTSTANTPAPKTKRARQGTAKKSRKKVAAESDDEDDTPAQPTFLISDMDSVSIKVTNNTKKPQNLDGWSLKAQANKKSFLFPSVPALKAGKSFTVALGGSTKIKGAAVWDDDGIFEEEDKVFLMSPEGIGHSSVAISDWA